MKTKLEDLKSLQIFENTATETLEKVIKLAYKINLNKGKILFWEKEKVENVYIVLQGKVTMYRISEGGKKRVIYILNKGDFINEVVFDDLPASVTCEAFEDSIIFAVTRSELLKIMESDFKFTKIIIESMGKKIRRLYRQLKNTVPIKMDKKLAAKLWKLSKDYGVKTEEGIRIDLNINITYLADMLGSTRETISRCVSNFEKEGLIKFSGKKLIVRNMDELSLYFRGK